jgi:hypothetical protein
MILLEDRNALCWKVPETALMRRKMLEQYPTFSEETISCLAPITDESGDSGRNTSLDGRAKLAFFFGRSRTILG